MIMKALTIPITSLAHADLTGVTVAQHHTKYADAAAILAVEGEATLDLLGDVSVAAAQEFKTDHVGFPATQVADAGPNILDDYEEGTFTPGIADNNGDGSGEGQAYTEQTGRYTKVGRVVMFTIRLKTTSLGTLTVSETVKIVGLPFTASGQSNALYNFTGNLASGLAIGAGEYALGQNNGSVAFFLVRLWDVTTGTSQMILSQWTADGSMVFSGTYEV